jgi:GNAT superfamily N-acetyltransferase
VGEEVTIRPFTERDAAQVRQLFITVNRLLSPPDLRDAFEAYIERALTEEIDRIPAYYGERNGGFWVAVKGDKVVGTFGLERASDDAMELRRMYVDPSARRQGIARGMLQFAENECRRRRIKRLELSTAEIQQAALALYRNEGYRLVREETDRGTEQQDCRFWYAQILSRKNFMISRVSNDAVHGNRTVPRQRYGPNLPAFAGRRAFSS